MARKIVFTSGKGGVGKTTLTVGIGMEMAKQNKSVLLVDCDIGLNNLDILTGVYNRITFDVLDAVEKKCRPSQAIYQHDKINGLYVLPSVKSFFSEQIEKSDFCDLINCYNNSFDFILLDCPAGIEYGFQRATNAADEAIVVCLSDQSSLSNANKVLSLLNVKFKDKMGILVNKIRGDLTRDEKMLSPTKIGESLSATLVGVMPDFDEISILESINGYFYPKSEKVLNAFKILSQNILMGQNLICDFEKDYIGLFGRFKRVLKRRI